MLYEHKHKEFKRRIAMRNLIDRVKREIWLTWINNKVKIIIFVVIAIFLAGYWLGYHYPIVIDYAIRINFRQ